MKNSKKVITVLGILMTVVLVLPRLAKAGSLTPTAPPAPTMHTLDEIYQKLDAIANQQIPLPTGLVLWPANPRFAIFDGNTPGDPMDDMVLDRSTGLIWTRNANYANGTKAWQEAVDYCNSLNWWRTDWRLPSIEELTTLTEPYPSTHNPALPIPNPFINVQSNYWSSTECSGTPGNAWMVGMDNGYVPNYGEASDFCVWPVRGGK